MHDSVSIFLQACLQIPSEWQLRLSPAMNVQFPPWRYPRAPDQGLAANNASGQRMDVRGVTSPTRQSTVDTTERVIDLEEEAASAIAAGLDFDEHDAAKDELDVETLGMTSQRQQEIQGSLFKMLGSEVKGDTDDHAQKGRDCNGAPNDEVDNAPSGEEEQK